MCGLKLGDRRNRITAARVTPFVGVWIETWNKDNTEMVGFVTPFVGVWIETIIVDNK